VIDIKTGRVCAALCVFLGGWRRTVDIHHQIWQERIIIIKNIIIIIKTIIIVVVANQIILQRLLEPFR